jgi:hypothetical protein
MDRREHNNNLQFESRFEYADSITSEVLSILNGSMDNKH